MRLPSRMLTFADLLDSPFRRPLMVRAIFHLSSVLMAVLLELIDWWSSPAHAARLTRLGDRDETACLLWYVS